jgi:hypothetical protein
VGFAESPHETSREELVHQRARGGEELRTIAILIAVAASALLLGIGTAKADCDMQCYDSGNTGEHCVTNCN